MSKIKAEIIADSINSKGNRVTTFVCTLPRIVLAELLTHRAFSRNSASSRAIPAEKNIETVINNPFIPLAWQESHKGMQGNAYIKDPEKIERNRKIWIQSRDLAIEASRALLASNVTKQLSNRLLEPYSWHKVIITTSREGLENFFDLRCPVYYIDRGDGIPPIAGNSRKQLIENYPNEIQLERDDLLGWLDLNIGHAEIHISLLAEEMLDAYNGNTPESLDEGEWHIPYEIQIDNLDPSLSVQDKVKISTAMCARISYTVIGEEKEIDIYSLKALHDRLLKDKHFSPFEHCAKNINISIDFANLIGFISYRSILDAAIIE